MIVLHALFGAGQGLAIGEEGAGNVLEVLHFVATAGVIFYWASLDARARPQALSAMQSVGIVLLGYFAMPFYLASARPPDTWPRWLSKGLAALACIITAFFVAFSLAARYLG
ncbi:hypothetical protein [Arenimonas oryziterrae]|uniref:hypothetical protein n=1 Tax=Arenimonas oryziterrae TaxID=498055 RepID=UPI0012DCB42A|nr:hypothetical protein [Arenimonas oryziterrae]